jgi:outer membrane receptor for ferrienterochelin and colicins
MWILLYIGSSLAEPTDADASSADEEIVITGTRTEKPRGESPVPVTVIDRDAIVASGAEDLAELLEDVAGVDLQRSILGASLRLQGLEPEHVLITVDGVRQIGRKDGILDLSRYPVEEIERIEVVKGSSSALYGSDAMGGVINIITRDAGDAFRGSGRLRYGSFSTIDATAGMSVRGWRLSGGYHQSAGYDLDPSTMTTDGAAQAGFEIAGSRQQPLGSQVDVEIQSSYTRRNPSRILATASGAIYDVQNLTENFQALVSPVIILDAQSKLTLGGSFGLFRDQYLNDQRGSEELDRYEDSRQNLVQANSQYDRLMGRHLVSVGAEVISENNRSPRLGSDGQRQRYALFVQEDWTRGGIEILPGARFEVDTQFGQQLSPKLALKWAPVSERMLVRLSYGRGFRAPSFRELLLQFENVGVGYQVLGNTDLLPERSHGLNGDVELEVTESVLTYVSSYMNWVSDLIAIDLADSEVGLATYSYINIGEARTRGGEAGVRWSPGMAELSADYALTDTLDVSADRPLPGRALHRGSLSAAVPILRIGLIPSGRARLVGEQLYFQDTNGDGEEETVTSNPYVALDLRAEQALSASVSLLVGANNVLDAGDDTLPLQPRQLYAGASGRF